MFAGTAVVGQYFKSRYSIISNDLLYFSYVIQKATIERNEEPTFPNLNSVLGTDPFTFLGGITPESHEFRQSPFVFENYSPGGIASRQYLTEENSLKIDAIRQTIEEWYDTGLISKSEYYYLLAGLIEAVPYVSNIAGTYGAFLKHWDKRSENPLALIRLPVTNNEYQNQSHNQDANTLINRIEGNILYLDPPYNQRQYISNYHLLETIAKYDNPEIKGITGLRSDDSAYSSFSRPKEVFRSFDKLIDQARFDLIIVSYSTEGILSEEEIIAILEFHGVAKTLKIKRIPYRRYKHTSAPARRDLSELLFSIKK